MRTNSGVLDHAETPSGFTTGQPARPPAAIDEPYNPDFEAALGRLLIAAADTAEFRDGQPHGRSRQASIRRLGDALDELHRVAADIILRRRTTL